MKDKLNRGEMEGERKRCRGGGKKKNLSVVVSGSGMFGKNEGLSHFVFLPVASECY